MPTCCETLTEEFRLRNFLYRFYNRRVFYCSQWPLPHIVFVIIRFILAGYAIFAICWEIRIYYDNIDQVNKINTHKRLCAELDHNGTTVPSDCVFPEDEDDLWSSSKPPYVFLTIWSFAVLILHLSVAALLSAVFYRKGKDGLEGERLKDADLTLKNITPRLALRSSTADDVSVPTKNTVNSYNNSGDGKDNSAFEDDRGSKREDIILEDYEASRTSFGEDAEMSLSGKLPWYFILSWLLSDIATPVALVVSISFWALIFPNRDNKSFELGNFNIHAVNSISVLIDQLLSARPIRIVHVYVPILYGIVYNIFNYGYWLLDKEEHVIYPDVLDWNDPGTAIMNIALQAFLLLPIVNFLFFCLYQLKLYIYRRISH